LNEPRISVAIPAYDEGEHLPAFLRDLATRGAAERRVAAELVVVDDGSAPADAALYAAGVRDAEAILREARAPHAVRLVAQPANGGKGAAIRRGWAEARADAGWLGFLDADGAVSAGEFWRLAARLAGEPSFDVLCGARILMAGRTIKRSLFRHLQGRVFATLTEQAFRLGFYDTQCGVKFARAGLLRPLTPHLRERGWLLDVEMLALLQRAGARCVEEPIDWADVGASKVRFGVDAARMALGLWEMRRRLEALTLSAELAVVPDDLDDAPVGRLRVVAR
jgi:dolichyl-phosphate beta-glucosyltransferase